jgi:hypothetical protein
MSDLSNDTKKHSTKSRETIPLIRYQSPSKFSKMIWLLLRIRNIDFNSKHLFLRGMVAEKEDCEVGPEADPQPQVAPATGDASPSSLNFNGELNLTEQSRNSIEVTDRTDNSTQKIMEQSSSELVHETPVQELKTNAISDVEELPKDATILEQTITELETCSTSKPVLKAVEQTGETMTTEQEKTVSSVVEITTAVSTVTESNTPDQSTGELTTADSHAVESTKALLTPEESQADDSAESLVVKHTPEEACVVESTTADSILSEPITVNPPGAEPTIPKLIPAKPATAESTTIEVLVTEATLDELKVTVPQNAMVPEEIAPAQTEINIQLVMIESKSIAANLAVTEKANEVPAASEQTSALPESEPVTDKNREASELQQQQQHKETAEISLEKASPEIVTSSCEQPLDVAQEPNAETESVNHCLSQDSQSSGKGVLQMVTDLVDNAIEKAAIAAIDVPKQEIIKCDGLEEQLTEKILEERSETKEQSAGEQSSKTLPLETMAKITCEHTAVIPPNAPLLQLEAGMDPQQEITNDNHEQPAIVIDESLAADATGQETKCQEAEVTETAANSRESVENGTAMAVPEQSQLLEPVVPRRTKTPSVSSVTEEGAGNRDSYQQTKEEIEESLSFIKSKLNSTPLPPVKSKRQLESASEGVAADVEQQSVAPDYEPIQLPNPPQVQQQPVQQVPVPLPVLVPKKAQEEAKPGASDPDTRQPPNQFARECIPPVRPMRMKKGGTLQVPEWRPPKENVFTYIFGCFGLRNK